jgi:hypothetical protein
MASSDLTFPLVTLCDPTGLERFLVVISLKESIEALFVYLLLNVG